MLSLREQRTLISNLLDVSSPIDAPTAYYALYHPPALSLLFSKQAEGAHAVRGFVGRLQTGYDLFRPLITLRCREAETAADLLADACVVGRPYVFFANLNQLALVGGSMQISNERIHSIYALDLASFRTEINVLVRTNNAPNGSPRAEISSGGYKAVAGVNWQSPGFAEIYVQTDPEVRGRGWGRSVVQAVTAKIRESGRIPIYLAEVQNTASIQIAESIGYRDTGARQVFADAVYIGHPGHKTPSEG